MYFNEAHADLIIYMCSKPVNVVRYIGNYFGTNISQLLRVIVHLFKKMNIWIADFSIHDSIIYCMNFFGCELWNYNSRYIKDIYISWHKGVRKLFRLPYRTHNYLVSGMAENISVKLDSRLIQFVHFMITSSTVLCFCGFGKCIW